MVSVNKIVDNFIEECRDNTLKELSYYQEKDTLRKAVESASWAEDPDGETHPHQQRPSQLNSKTFQEIEKILLENLDELRSCSSFKELIETVESKIGDIGGVGPLMLYDTSQRIGAYLDIMPEKVFLHRGTKEGAEALGFDSGRDSISPEELPEPFQKLEPYEIEDCLCLYHEHLEGEKELEGTEGCRSSDSSEKSSKGCR